jgi:translocation and assembly module TamB
VAQNRAFWVAAGYDPMAVAMQPSYRNMGRRRRRDLGRLVARFFCLIFGIIGAVPFGIGLLVRTAPVRAWAARETAAVLARELGVVASYRVRVEAWPLAVRLDEVTVDGSDGLGKALAASRVSVRPRLFSLLAGRLDAGHIDVDGPRVRLVVRQGTIRNVTYRLPKTSGRPSTRAPFASVAVTDAAVDLDLEGFQLSGRDIDVDVAAEDGLAFDIALRAGEQNVVRTRPEMNEDGPSGQTAVDNDVLCQLDARLRIMPGGVLVRRLTAVGVLDADPQAGTSPGCQLGDDDPRRIEIGMSHLQAAMDADGRPEIEGSVHARIPVAVVNRFVPFLPVRGYVTVDVDGHYGRTGALPEVRGRVRAKGLELERYRLAADLDADLQIDAGAIRSTRAAVGFADGTVVANHLVIEPLKKGAPIRVGSVDINNVQFAAMMRDLGVTQHAHEVWFYKQGRVVSLEGTLDPVRMDAEFTMATSDFEVFDRAIDAPGRLHMIGVKEAKIAGHLGIRPDAVILRGCRVDFGQSHLEVTVSIGFHNDIVLSVAEGSRVDLGDITPLGSLKIGGKATVAVEMKGKFGDPLLTGDLAITGLSIDDFPLGDVTSAKARFRPLVVDFLDVHGKTGKSEFVAPSLRLDFDGPAVLVVDASIDASVLHVRDFFHMWHFDTDPRFDQIEGQGRATASVHYDLGGKADKCGNGYLGVKGGLHMGSFDLFAEHFDGLDSEFSYVWADRDAADLGLDVDVRSLTLKKGRGSVFGSGTIRRGGVVRANLVADDVLLSKIQGLGSLGKGLDGTASAVATVGGTMDEIEADVDVRLSPLRVATSVLPASRMHVVLAPKKKHVRVVGRTACGQPITPPFDRAEYDRDPVQGAFNVDGELFGGQVALSGLTVTRQRSKTSSGLVKMRDLDVGPFVSLAMAGNAKAAQKDDSGIEGTFSGSLDIGSLPLDAPSMTRAVVTLDRFDLKRDGMQFALKSAAAPISIADDRLAVPLLQFAFSAGYGLKAAVAVGGDVKKLSTGPEANLSVTLLPMDLSKLASATTRVERASGTVEANVAVTGKLAAPTYVGEAHVKKADLSVRGLATPLSDINVDVAIASGEIRVVRGSAQVGGGTLSLGGHAPIHGLTIGEATAIVAARGVSVPVSDGVNLTCDADLRAEWGGVSEGDEEQALPRISGDVTLTSFSYSRPIGVASIGSLVPRGPRTFDAYDPANDVVSFDVRLRSREPLRLRNDLVEAQLLVDSDALVFSGTNQRFGLRGRLKVLPGGRVRLRTSDFEVRHGYVRFDDPSKIAPGVDITAVTDYRRYSNASTGSAGKTAATGAASTTGTAGTGGGVWRITLHAYGDADNLTLDMTSEPALSQEDIVLLLTIGMTRAELDQMQAANIGETAALEAISSLTGADSAVKKAVPVIDDFGFGNAYSSRTGRTEPTVTVGKRVTDKVRANVTSGLSENREIRSNVELRLTPRVSVQGSYDNVNDVSSSVLGNLGADVRWRLEFE